MNADPTFVYEQQMARVFGLEALHMADTDVLPYDYVTYARQIQAYLFGAQARAKDVGMMSVDFDAALGAAGRFAGEAMSVMAKQVAAKGDPTAMNALLRAVEHAPYERCCVEKTDGAHAWPKGSCLAQYPV